MTSIKKNALAVCALVLLGCAAMTVVDGVLRPPYAVKSAVKLTLFLLAPLLYEYTAGRDGHRALFRIQRRALLRALALGLGVFALILSAYFALRGIFDFSAVTALLDKNAGVTAENFLWVSLYVSFVNSLLEEFFFRGCAFLVLRRYAGERFACLFSALSFALYHTAMMLGWFSPRGLPRAAYFLIFSTQGLGRSSPLGQFISLQTLPSTRSALFFSRSYKISEIWWESQANNA